jgi:predicted nucleotidyltransferase
MKITGIITEYNPFHNGHLYHLKQSKKITNSNYVICILNGNFVQRGRPALIDKWTKTKMALKNGVDLVIELPLIYGIRSAEYFATGSIKILNNIKLIDNIVFGSEIGKIKPLQIIADILLNEPQNFKNKLKYYLSQGLCYPEAREKALIYYCNQQEYKYSLSKNLIKQTISEPNNILGIEYIKALKKTNSSIQAMTIKRTHSNYHLPDLHQFASATAIRKLIYQKNNSYFQIKKYVPETTWKILKNSFSKGKIPIKKHHFYLMILNKIRQMNISNLQKFAEINNGLENTIYKAAFNSGTGKQLINNIKSKTFTQTRIERNLLHIFFNLTSKQFQKMNNNGPQYIRILGFNKNREKLLSLIKNNSTLPIITQPADYLKSIAKNYKSPLKQQLKYDILASDIYTLLYPESKKRQGHQDFYQPIIKI